MAHKFDPQVKYAKSHEWVRMEGEVAVIGVSDYAQHLLSDVVYVELPEVGDTLTKGESLGTVESVKAASDIFSPLAGTVAEVNGALADAPERINEDPYGEGWIFVVKPDDADQYDELLDPGAYQDLLDQGIAVEAAERDVIVVDPMLATGNSASAAIDRLKKLNPRSIKFVCLLAAPEGIATLQKAHPDVPIFTAAIDRELNDHGYILPGLGDAGDRIFGTK